jgi:hypothetical protein
MPFSGSILSISDGNAYMLFSRFGYFSLPTWMMLTAAFLFGLTMAATYIISWILLMFITKK